MRRDTAALLAGGAVLAAAFAGSRHGPTPDQPRTAAWYASLRKPSFTPPGAAIGAAWVGLDVLLCVSGYRLMTAPPSPARNVALTSWASNVAGLAGFSFVFFGRKRLDASMGVTGAMLASALVSVASAMRVDRMAGMASVPLAAWVGFASLLNEEIWRRK
jgi:benzodiazapine receptor